MSIICRKCIVLLPKALILYIINQKVMTNIKKLLSQVKAFVFDVDGVFSRPEVLLHPGGEMMRTMNIKDGYIVQYAIKKGYPIAIITGGFSESVNERFRKLGLTDIYARSTDKKNDLEDFIFKYHLSPENILYMGDDIPDIDSLIYVGVPCCPSDAAEEVKAVCKYISDKKGGEGCVRDVMEQTLKLHGQWMDPNHIRW